METEKNILPESNLEKIHFESSINANPEKVYKIMLDAENYKLWTKPFNHGSYFEGNWDEGSKIVFLGAAEDGSSGGLIGRVIENKFASKVSVAYFGLVEKGQEILSGKQVEMLQGSVEEYTFRAVGGKTQLNVSIDVDPSWKAYLMDTWPLALQALKEICEK